MKRVATSVGTARLAAMAAVIAVIACCSGCGNDRSSSPVATAQEFVYTTSLSTNSVDAYALNQDTGALTPVIPSQVAAGPSPLAIAADSVGRHLYVINYLGAQDGTISAFSVDPASGIPAAVAGSPYAAGPGASKLVADPRGRFLYVANRDWGTITAYAINASTGALTAVPGSPFAAGMDLAAIAVDPSGTFVYVADNGFLQVAGFSINSTTGALTPVPGSPVSAGTDPLAIVVHPSGKYLYVTNWISASEATVLAWNIDPATGQLTPMAGSPFSVGADADAAAVDPSGKFLYVTTSRTAAVSGFTISETDGRLTPIATSFPTLAAARIVIDPTGKFAFVMNGTTGDVSVFAIDGTSGALSPTAGPPVIRRASGVAVMRVP